MLPIVDENVQKANQGKGKKLSNVGAKEGVAARNCALMVFNAILPLLPWPSASIWIPEVAAIGLAPLQSLHMDSFRNHPYVWDATSRLSTWAHSWELSPAIQTPMCIRILVCVSDQGSDVWAMIQFLAIYVFMRIFPSGSATQVVQRVHKRYQTGWPRTPRNQRRHHLVQIHAGAIWLLQVLAL